MNRRRRGAGTERACGGSWRYLRAGRASERVAERRGDAVVVLLTGLAERLAVVIVVERQVDEKIADDLVPQGDVGVSAIAIVFGETRVQGKFRSEACLGRIQLVDAPPQAEDQLRAFLVLRAVDRSLAVHS